MAWTNGKRELIVHARLPLEQGLAFENAIWSDAKARRAIEKRDAVVHDWQQSTADALVALTTRSGTPGRNTRPAAMLVVHISDDAPAMLEGAGPISPETAERMTCGQPRLFIKRDGDDIAHTTEGRVASEPQKRAMHHRSPHCQYPGCTSTRDLEAHHMIPWARGGRTRVGMMILLCSRHHDYCHDHNIRISGTGQHPISPAPTGG